MLSHVEAANTMSQAALTGQRDEALTPDQQSISSQPLKYKHRTNKHTRKGPYTGHTVQRIYRLVPAAETSVRLICSGNARAFAGYPFSQFNFHACSDIFTDTTHLTFVVLIVRFVIGLVVVLVTKVVSITNVEFVSI